MINRWREQACRGQNFNQPGLVDLNFQDKPALTQSLTAAPLNARMARVGSLERNAQRLSSGNRDAARARPEAAGQERRIEAGRGRLAIRALSDLCVGDSI